MQGCPAGETAAAGGGGLAACEGETPGGLQRRGLRVC